MFPYGANIETRFKKGNPGGKKGRKNRGTTIKKWLKIIEKHPNLLKNGEIEDLTQEDIIAIAAIAKAKKGNIRASKFVMENAYWDDVLRLKMMAGEEMNFTPPQIVINVTQDPSVLQNPQHNTENNKDIPKND